MEILIIATCLPWLCFFCTLCSLGIDKPSLSYSLFGISIAFFISWVLICSSSKDYISNPSAIEVYQGKTTLKYKIIDGEVIDSCVVYKQK